MTQCDRLNHSTRSAGWKHGEVAVVGLTGAIGGGKSTAAALLARRGAFVIDADSVGHQVLNEPLIRARLIERFGPEILAPAQDQAGRPIDRRALGAIVFADPAARRDLESIVHPVMRARFLAQIAQTLQSRSAPLIVLDAAILFEAGWDDLCDRIVYIDAPRAVRLDRVERSRGWTADRLLARERAQAPADDKIARADLVLDNDGDPAALDRGLDRLRDLLGNQAFLRLTDHESSLERDSTRSPLLERTRRL